MNYIFNSYGIPVMEKHKEGNPAAGLCFTMESPTEIGQYGKLRRKFLIENHHSEYMELLVTGRLELYLYEIDSMANTLAERLTELLLQQHNVPACMEHPIEETDYQEKLSDIYREVDDMVLNEPQIASAS